MESRATFWYESYERKAYVQGADSIISYGIIGVGKLQRTLHYAEQTAPYVIYVNFLFLVTYAKINQLYF